MAKEAVVGVLRAILTADTAQFDASLKRSAQKVTAFGEETTRAAANIAKSLSGERIVKQAMDTAEAIRLIGGASKLTAAEAARLAPVFDAAATKMKAMGLQVPADMMKTQAALKQVADQGAKTGGVFDSLGAKMTAAFSAGLLVDRGITALFNFGKQAIKSAGEIQDMSTRLGVSTDAVQEWTFAAGRSGATMDDVSRAVVQMNDRLASGNASTVASLKLAGLEFQTLRAMKPEEAFNAIVKAIKDIEDPMLQTRVAMDVFGKSGVEMLAAIKAGMTDQMALAPKMSAATIEGLDKAEEEWELFLNHLMVKTGEAIVVARKLHEAYNITTGPGFYMWGKDKVAGLGRFSIPGAPRAGLPGTGADAPDLDELERVSKELREQVVERLKGFEKETSAVDKLNERYEAYKKLIITGVTPAQRELLSLEERLRIETTKGVAALDLRIQSTEAFMRTQQRLALTMTPPPGGRVAMGDPTGRGAMGDPISLFPGPSPAQVRDMSTYTTMLNVAQTAMRNFGNSARPGFKLVSASLEVMIQGWKDVASAADAAGKASAASGAATAGAMGIAMFAVQSIMADLEKQEAGARRLREFNQSVMRQGFTNAELMRQMIHLMQTNRDAYDELMSGRTGQEAMTEWIRRFQENISGLIGDLHELGTRAPNALQPMIASLLESTRLTEEQRTLLRSMQQDMSWEELQAAAERYGIAIDSLGSAFQQNRIGSQFDDIFTDFTNLTEGGADATAVLRGMSDEVQALLNDAMRFGTALPEFMRPMLQSMVDMGLLLDENGNALTDLSRFSFTASIESSFQRMADILEQIRDLLANVIPAAGSAAAAVEQIKNNVGSGGGKKLPGGVSTPGDGVTMPRIIDGPTLGEMYRGSGGMAVSASGGDTYIQAMDVQSFESWLRAGANRAVLRTLPDAVKGANLNR